MNERNNHLLEEGNHSIQNYITPPLVRKRETNERNKQEKKKKKILTQLL